MRLRTFDAPSMAAAMRLARAELGSEAVILATEKFGNSVRLTAALEEGDISAIRSTASNTKNGAMHEIEAVARALENHGVPNDVRERILAVARGTPSQDADRSLSAALRTHFEFRPLTKFDKRHPILLVGQPGAGKTSCAAKLAAMAIAKGRTATLITCDIAKAGAVEQLAIYARALQVPAYRAKNVAALRRAVDRASGDGAIIIDSVGTNPFDPAERQSLDELAKAANAEPVFVLASGGDPVEAVEMAQCYGEIGAQRMIATKLDASRRLGGLLAAADHGELAFSEFSHSPEIAVGVTEASAAFLSARLMRINNHAKASKRDRIPVSGSPS